MGGNEDSRPRNRRERRQKITAPLACPSKTACINSNIDTWLIRWAAKRARRKQYQGRRHDVASCARGRSRRPSPSVPGVTAVSVNLGSEKAEVTYNPRMASPSDMRQGDRRSRIPVPGRRRGGDGRPGGAARARDLREKLKRVIVGFVVGIPLMVVMFFPMGHARVHALRHARQLRRPSSPT